METDQVSNKLVLSQFESKLYIVGFAMSGQNVGLYNPIGWGSTFGKISDWAALFEKFQIG